jgi:hypothetical protein
MVFLVLTRATRTAQSVQKLGYGLNNLELKSWLGAVNFFFHNIQTGYVVHPASYSMGTRVLSQQKSG